MVELIAEICQAIIESREQITQPDLRPDNVYVEERPGRSPRVKLVGASVELMRSQEDDDTIAAVRDDKYGLGKHLPSLDYQAPERLMGKQLDGRTEVYEIGLVAYQLLTGRLPFADAKGPAGLITAHLKQRPAPPSSLRPHGIPPAVDAVVLRCLEKDRNDRYPDVAALAAALSAVK